MRLFSSLVLVALMGCGGAMEDERSASRDPSPPTSRVDPLEKLRARCAEPWKNHFSSDVTPSRTLAAGRWLRCPGDTIASGRPYVVSFDAVELTADNTFYRLAVGANGFERSASKLGDTGRWELRPDGELWFELPPCAAGYVETPNGRTCGGLDVATPLFEASPTRMRFYGAAHWYVKDE